MRPEWFVEQEPEKPPEISTQDYSSLKKAEPEPTPEKHRPEWSTPNASKKEYYSDAIGLLNELPTLQDNKGFEGVKQTLEKLDPQQRDTELSKIQTSMWLADRFEMKPSTVYRNFDTISREFWGEVTQPQSAFNSIKQSWILGKKETELGQLRYRQIMGEDVSEEIEKLKKSMPAEDQKKRMLPVGMAKSMMRMLPTMLEGLEQGAQRGLALGAGAAGTAAIAGQIGPQALLAEELATVPGAFVSMFGVGALSGTMENIGQIEAGLSYDELIEMGVSDGIAKGASLGVGAINAALETMQIKRVPGMDALVRKAMGKTFTAAFKNGTIFGVAKTAMKKYGTNVSEQVIQEVMQETTSVMAGEFAKQLNNIYKGSDIPYSEINKITSRLGETAIEAAKGFALMGVPGTVAETFASSKAQSGRNISEVDLEGQLWDRLANAEGKELDELVEAINEQTGENNKTETKIDIEPGTAKIKSGDKEVNVNYSVDDDVLTIDTFGDLNAYEAREVLATMQNQYPDRVMQFAEDIEGVEQLKRGLEDLDPKVRAVNMQMDKVSDTLEGLKSELEETQGQMQQKRAELSQAKQSKAPQEEISSMEMEVESFQSQVEEIGFSIESMSDTFESLKQTKDNYNPLEYRESWSMTSGEYRRNLQARNMQEADITTSTVGTSLKAEIKQNIPNLTEEQTDASVRLVEAMARAKGQNVQEYVGETFRFATEQEKQKVQRQASSRGVGWSGAHQIGEDGRSIIAASESADFSTFIHELGHVLRRTLTPEEESVVAEWAGAVENEDGTYTWSEYADESFAEGFTEYLRSGKAPTQELENIFRKIANFLKEIANRVFQDIQLSPEVEDVFSELLGAEREQVLFQTSPEAKKAFEEVIEERGRTQDLMEAGYVLPNGRKIDFTGRNEAVGYYKEGDYYITDDDDYLAGERAEDYRAIDWEGAPDDGIDRMLKFIELGAMRVDAAAGLINIANPPTVAQQKAIQEIAEMNGDNVTVEIETPAGEYSFYSEASPKKLIGAINRYFSTKKKQVEQGEILFQPAPPKDSEAFKDWFGDSKVKDDSGEPKVVYHGSPDVRGILSGEGFKSQLREGQFFFTDDYNVANSYADDKRAFDYQNAEPQTVPVYLSIENPMIIDVEGKSWRRTEERVQEARKKGHDGIIAKNSRDEYNAEGGGRLSTVYIAFDPTQIKSAMTENLRSRIDGIDLGGGPNRGIFDPDNPNILFQRSPEHEAEVQRAVEIGLPVPSNVLREYSDKEWATEELSRREAVLQKLTDFNWLAQDARDYDNVQGFIDYVQSDFFEFTAKEDHPELYGGNEQVSNQWLEEFWRDVQEQNAFMETTLEEGNKRWLSQVDDNYIKEVVRQIAEQYAGQKGKSLSIHGKFYAAAAKIKNGKGFEQKDIDTMKKVIENNPTRYREVLSIILDDQEEWQRLRVQEYGDLAAGKQTPEEKIQPKSRIDLAKEIEQLNKEKVQSGSYTAGEVDDLYTQVSKQLKAADRKINTLERELKEEKGSSTVQVEKGRQKNEQLKAQITDLEKSIKSYTKKLDKLSDKDQAQRETIDSARREARMQLKELQEEYKEFVQSAQKEARKGAEEATKTERARQKELQKKKREAKQLREYKERLARVIRRPVPKSVHWEYREMIESIQAGIDPHFRSKRTRLVWDKRREYFARNPEMLNELSPDFSRKLWKQSLDEFKLYELEEVADQINHLTQLGKTKLRIIREQRQYEAQKTAQSIGSKLLSGEPPAKPDPIIEEKEGVGEKGQALYLSTIRPSRLADMVDGGADFKGLAHKVFIDEVNEAYAQALRDRYAREEKVKAKMETLGITFNDLTEEVEIDGVSFTKDQIFDIAAAYQNRLKWRAVIHGNNIPVQTALRAINSLTEAEMEFVDSIIGDYEENYNRLRKAHLDYTNEDMGSEENYTPMIRTEQDYTTHKEQIASEILSRKGLRQGTPERGMTKHRIEIANRHQRPIKLGLYETWSAQVPRQEHYIASAEQILKLNRIMRNDYFKAAVDQQIGRPMYKELQSYIDRFANPNIYKSFGTWDKAIKKVRNNVALAYLAFNMMTMIKQVPSLAFYMAEAGPGDLLAGLSKSATNWKETRKFIEDRDPQMRERAIERDMEELKRMKAKGYQKIQKAIGDTGMKGILFFDKLATTSGWIATYDKYKRKGYSEAEAVKAARDVTLRTQPQASAKDIASLWAQDGPLTLFTQFSNQLNQIWNMATYDMPAALRQHNFEKAFGMTAGMVLSGTVIWMLSNRRPPEDLEDWAEVMAEQGMNMIPILGPVAARAMDGWTTDVSVFAPAQGVGELAGLMKKLASGEDVSEYTIDSTVRSALEGLAIATGMPFVTPNRAIRGFGDDAVVQYILFGGKLKGSKEE